MDSTRTASRIVLAEDNPADVGLVREALREHKIDYDLRVLSDGEEALASVRRSAPDLVLLDMRMPGIDGVETLRRIRTLASDAVVIIVSEENGSIAVAIEGALQEHLLRAALRTILIERFGEPAR